MTTTTDAATAPAETFARLAPGLIDPDPDNRSAPVDAEFRKSVAEHGVLEPVLVAPHPDADGRYMLIAGERRWRAATEAACADIPAVVISGLSETDRIVRQIAENVHRLDLAPVAEAQQFMRLTKLGMSVRDLAREVSRSQRYVRDRLRLVELPAAGRKLIDDHSWSIEDGLAATKLLDQPELLDELIAQGGRNVAWRVDQMLAEAERTEAVRALVDKAQSDGLTLVEIDDRQRELTSLGISPKEHGLEECHGWIVKAHGFGPPKLVAVCTNPKNHRKRGKSTVKSTSTTGQGLSDAEAARRRDIRDANAQRLEAIAAAVAGKVNRTEASLLVLTALIAATSAEDAKTAARVLGIEGDKDTYWPTALADYAAGSHQALQRAALAVALVAGNGRIHRGHPAADRHDLAGLTAEFLGSRGWKPTAYDKKQLEVRKVNEA